MAQLNPASLRIVDSAVIEPSLVEAAPGQRFQFEREGYFVADSGEHTREKPVYNLTIGLRDVWQNAGAAG